MQVELQVSRNLIEGAAVLEYISEKFPEEDLGEMDALLDGLEAILADIESLKDAGDAESLAAGYFSAKKDAQEITKKFRGLSMAYLESEDREEIAARIAGIDRRPIDELDGEIVSQIRARNSQNVERILMYMGIRDPFLADGIKSGVLSRDDALNAVSKGYLGLDENRKRMALMMAREGSVRDRVLGRSMGDYVSEFCESSCCGEASCVDNRLREMKGPGAMRLRPLGERMGCIQERENCMGYNAERGPNFFGRGTLGSFMEVPRARWK
jgi:hypothetical protein